MDVLRSAGVVHSVMHQACGISCVVGRNDRGMLELQHVSGRRSSRDVVLRQRRGNTQACFSEARLERASAKCPGSSGMECVSSLVPGSRARSSQLASVD